MKRVIIFLIIITGLIACWALSQQLKLIPNKDLPKNDTNPFFKLSIIDKAGPKDPWGKSVGDINGDGLIDLIVGGHSARELRLFDKVIRKLGFSNLKEPSAENVMLHS